MKMMDAFGGPWDNDRFLVPISAVQMEIPCNPIFLDVSGKALDEGEADEKPRVAVYVVSRRTDGSGVLEFTGYRDLPALT